MKIQVLGSGCPTCQKLYEVTKRAAEEMKLSCSVEYVSGDGGIKRIIELGSMSSPVLAINNRVAMTGFTSDINKIKDLIKNANK